jgi:hypothetical protein
VSRRPLTRLATVGLAGHVFFELAAGVGMPFASVLGPVPAAAVWAAGSAALGRLAGRPAPCGDRVLAVADGLGAAAVVAHLAGWPRRRTRIGLPWLVDCEGLGPELMRWYNPIVYVSGVGAVGGLLWENRGAPPWLGWSLLATVPLLARLQHAEHRRLRALAGSRPGWWNRRLQEQPVSAEDSWAPQQP